MATQIKSCSKCGVIWPLNDRTFRCSPSGKWRGECRECERQACREYSTVRDQPAYLVRWKEKYPERIAGYRKAERDRARERRLRVLMAYGGLKCRCCGEDFVEFLTLDHVYGGGTQHRKTMKGAALYVYLERENYPDKGLYRVLCSNCNSALARTDNNTFESLRKDVMLHRATNSPATPGIGDDSG